MKDFLSQTEVESILTQAWGLSSSPFNKNDIEKLKLSDWDVLSEDIRILFENETYVQYGLHQFTGEAYMKMVGRSITKKNRAIFTLVLYILLKKKLISENDMVLLNDFTNSRTYFLQQYLQKSQIISKIDTLTYGGMSAQYLLIPKRYIPLIFFGIGSLTLLIVFLLYKEFTSSNIEEAVTKKFVITDDPNLILTFRSDSGNFTAPCDVYIDYDLTKSNHKNAAIKIFDKSIPLQGKKGTIRHTFSDQVNLDLILQVDEKQKYFFLNIKSDGWTAYIDKYKNKLIAKSGVLHFDINDIPSPILEDGEYYVNYCNNQDFKINSDELIFEVRIKNSPLDGGISCYDIAFDLNGRKADGARGVLSFNLLSIGCESYAKLIVGDLKLPSGDQKLLSSGINTADWTIVKVKTHNRNLSIFKNEEKIHDVNYKGSIGDLKYIQIGFKGGGHLDWVKMHSSIDNRLLYDENFDNLD